MHCVPKKVGYQSASNLNWFSKFFQQQICSKVITKDPTTP